jgi:hypothetical protein
MLRQSGWTGFPSGEEKVVMELVLSKSDIESRFGLVFISGEDSLGKVDTTYFVDELLGPVAIACYQKSPHGRAIVFVDSRLELKLAVPRLREVFGLDPSHVYAPVELD